MEMEEKKVYNNINKHSFIKTLSSINFIQFNEKFNFTIVEHRKWHRRRNKDLILFFKNYHNLRVYSSKQQQKLFLFLNYFSLEKRKQKWSSFLKLNNLPLSSLFLFSTASEISKNETNYFEENIYKNFTENIWQQIDDNNNNYQKFKRKNEQKLTKKQLFTKIGLIKENIRMCHIWNKKSPSELCSLNKWERIKKMNELSLFTICANESTLNLFVENNFKIGQLGQSCILGNSHSSECLICFERLGKSLEKLEKIFWSFSQLLQRFDCRQQQYFENKKEKQKQQISTTRPFSPNTTCDNCAEWYKKWLLVNLLDIWKKKVCINWCYYTQLACPHLATNKVVEFAGHPVFLCKDQMLSTKTTKNILDCSCFHPCDLIRNKIAQFNTKQQLFNNSSLLLLEPLSSHSTKKQQITNFDFFHVSSYCQNREKLIIIVHKIIIKIVFEYI
ncbi:Serine/threonine-protein phosphatase [Meloidogyne graminicola]|uniref:Serine/threonine-protein phosphatase n=1 Tax=Meloidogyne graminicola TaxID=189291 RepID=A0A8S9ZZH5_9BILA|nr:Serine/threonine-protein phosphatase [Meloidogyne graminicola]